MRRDPRRLFLNLNLHIITEKYCGNYLQLVRWFQTDCRTLCHCCRLLHVYCLLLFQSSCMFYRRRGPRPSSSSTIFSKHTQRQHGAAVAAVALFSHYHVRPKIIFNSKAKGGRWELAGKEWTNNCTGEIWEEGSWSGIKSRPSRPYYCVH